VRTPSATIAFVVLAILGNAGNIFAQDEKSVDFRSKTVAQWVEDLKDLGDYATFATALAALGPDGPYAQMAAPALIDALDNENETIRLEIAVTLADYGPGATSRLLRALLRSEALVRAGAAEALGRIEPRCVAAVPALIDLLKDPAHDARAAAAFALGSIGRSADKSVPALLALLQDEEIGVRLAVVQSLGNLGPTEEAAVRGLIRALKDEEILVRRTAVSYLGQVGPKAKSAVPALIEALQDRQGVNAEGTVAQALGQIGPAAHEAVPALIDALKRKDYREQITITKALGDIGPGAKAAVPELMKMVKETNNDWAAAALGKIGPDAKAAVPVLIEALAKDDYGTVSRALGLIGPEAINAIPKLLAIARGKGKQQNVMSAALAIVRIDPLVAAREDIELAHPDVRPGKVPAIRMMPRPAASDDQKKCIKELIAELAMVRDPDIGMSGTAFGSAFAPLPGRQGWQGGLLTDMRTKTSDAFRSLVKLGPVSLPFLLEALEDNTPTKLKVGGGIMSFSALIEGNPVNLAERRILSKDRGSDTTSYPRYPHRVKVGDACFVAIGQIVGRRYDAVRYVPTAFVSISSPAEDKFLRERVREIWSSKDPTQKLFDSLLVDYATEGIFNGTSLDGWHRGSQFQSEAAMRMLYYFPNETAPLIAARLKSLDVRRLSGDEDMKREVKNGVDMIDFIKAVSWCQVPSIKEALADVAKRTGDPAIKKLLPNAKK